MQTAQCALPCEPDLLVTHRVHSKLPWGKRAGDPGLFVQLQAFHWSSKIRPNNRSFLVSCVNAVPSDNRYFGDRCLSSHLDRSWAVFCQPNFCTVSYTCSPAWIKPSSHAVCLEHHELRPRSAEHAQFAAVPTTRWYNCRP